MPTAIRFDSSLPVCGDTTTLLHEQRLSAVVSLLVDDGATTVLDLGCGAGALLQRLVAEDRFTKIIGVDSSAEALLLAERAVTCGADAADERVSLLHGSYTDADERLVGFDAAVLVETIEHVEPAHLSQVERAVFGAFRPDLVVVTTPNREYNALYGIPDGAFRHVDHRFEWDRSRFESWARGVGERNGYRVIFDGIGPRDAWLGSPTQMGVFRRESQDQVSICGPAESTLRQRDDGGPPPARDGYDDADVLQTRPQMAGDPEGTVPPSLRRLGCPDPVGLVNMPL